MQCSQDEMEYADLQFMGFIPVLDVVNRTLGRVSSDAPGMIEVDHSVLEGQGKWRVENLQVGQWFGIELLCTV